MAAVPIPPHATPTCGGHEAIVDEIDVEHPYLFCGQYISTGRSTDRRARWNIEGVCTGMRRVLDLDPHSPEFRHLVDTARALGWKD